MSDEYLSAVEIGGRLGVSQYTAWYLWKTAQRGPIGSKFERNRRVYHVGDVERAVNRHPYVDEEGPGNSCARRRRLPACARSGFTSGGHDQTRR